MSHIIDANPSTYEEVVGQTICKDAMMEEYLSIMKNDVWEAVLRLYGNFYDLQVDLGIKKNIFYSCLFTERGC